MSLISLYKYDLKPPVLGSDNCIEKFLNKS